MTSSGVHKLYMMDAREGAASPLADMTVASVLTYVKYYYYYYYTRLMASFPGQPG